MRIVMSVRRIFSVLSMILILLPAVSYSQSKVGTTAAQFLGIGVGARATGMGGAFGAVAADASALYWNPGGIARNARSEANISHTGWLVGADFNWAGVVIALDRNNAIGVHLTQLNYGEDYVTTIEQPMGTGDKWSAMDIAAGISYARNLTDRFSIGGSVKYINQRIWSVSASAFAVDVGLLFITGFNDMQLGVSISNFGSEMKMDGKDLNVRYDLDSRIPGTNDAISARLSTDSFVLPLLFRVGVAMPAIRMEKNLVTVSMDALYPNDATPYMSTGIEYIWNDMIALRGGYRSLFMDEPIETWTLGGGVKLAMSGNISVAVDYVYQEFDVFKNVQTISISLSF
jgi:hypothetical protein